MADNDNFKKLECSPIKLGWYIGELIKQAADDNFNLNHPTQTLTIYVVPDENLAKVFDKAGGDKNALHIEVRRINPDNPNDARRLNLIRENLEDYLKKQEIVWQAEMQQVKPLVLKNNWGLP